MTNSQAMIADSVNSAGDIFSSSINDYKFLVLLEIFQLFNETKNILRCF